MATKERPILFSGEMVRAILEGRKTQTRRIIKPQPPQCDGRWSFIASSTEKGETGKFRYSWLDANGTAFTSRGRESGVSVRCPYGTVGDRLWVRETFGIDPFGNMPGHLELLYRATSKIDPDYPVKWKPSIHMPRWASRITLEITDVRVERLQDISKVDAAAEGFQFKLLGKWEPSSIAIKEFQSLWCEINGVDSWSLNPWVWVIGFRKMEQ